MLRELGGQGNEHPPSSNLFPHRGVQFRKAASPWEGPEVPCRAGPPDGAVRHLWMDLPRPPVHFAHRFLNCWGCARTAPSGASAAAGWGSDLLTASIPAPEGQSTANLIAAIGGRYQWG